MQVNEEEDRRRLKEKLKEALESARRNFQLSEESEGEVQLERERVVIVVFVRYVEEKPLERRESGAIFRPQRFGHYHPSYDQQKVSAVFNIQYLAPQGCSIPFFAVSSAFYFIDN
jgi:hypothetical protein